MLDTDLLHTLPRLSPPVMTAYLDTNPAKSRNQGHPPGYLIWLKSRGRTLRQRAPKAEQKFFRQQLERVGEYLRTRPPRERGVALFAGPEAWQVLPLQVEVEDELHWGRPSLTQLLWLLDEHQKWGAAVVDRSGARLFRFRMGAAEEDEKSEFKIDMKQWRKTHLVPPAHPGVQKTRGAQRDVFEQRVEAQYDKFYREAAERIRAWAERERHVPTFVAGPAEVSERIWEELPERFRERAALVKGDLMNLSAAEILERLEPRMVEWKRAQELQEVEQMLANPNGSRAVVGLDEPLRRVQQGEARSLVVVRGLGGRLRQCTRCGWVDRSADRACAACGGERRVVALRAVLPELARRYGVPVEIVAGEAAKKLREAGGLGAWLR